MIQNWFLSVALAFLVIGPASADLKVGDRVEYDLVSWETGVELKGEVIREIVSYNASSRRFTMRSEARIPGESPEIVTAEVDDSEFMTTAELDHIMANCTSFGGVVENFVIQGATIPSCKASDGGDAIWFAHVPFGIIKISEIGSAGKESTATIRNFNFGP